MQHGLGLDGGFAKPPRGGFTAAVLLAAALALTWVNPTNVGPSPMIWSILCGVPGLVLLLLTPANERAKALAWGLLLGAGLSAVVGLAQRAGVGDAWTPWVSYSVKDEAFGNLRQRNQFASLLVMGAVAVLWWVRGASLRGEAGRHALVGVAVASLWALLMAAIAASNSRTGLLALLLVCLWVVVRWRHASGWQRLLALSGLPIYLTMDALLPPLAEVANGVDRLSSTLSEFGQDALCSSRTVLWRNVWYLIQQSPWVGWGAGELDWAHFMVLFPGTRFCDLLDNAHNLPLHLAVEWGLPIALVLMGALAWFVWRNKPWREPNPDRLLAWGVLGVTALHSLVEYPLWYGPFQLTACMAVAVLFAPELSGDMPTTVPGWRKTAAAVLAALGAYVCADYLRVAQIYTAPSKRWASSKEDPITPASKTLLFGDLVNFARLGMMTPDKSNAAEVLALAERLMHYSPEASVVSKLITAAQITGDMAKAQGYALRFERAYPNEYAKWMAETGGLARP